MSEDRCPFCDSTLNEKQVLDKQSWTCDSHHEDHGDKFYRTDECYERQISNMTTALEAKDQALKEAQERLALWREHWKIVDSHYLTEAYDYSDKGKEKELKAIGEIGG